jgi:hypothetical protein
MSQLGTTVNFDLKQLQSTPAIAQLQFTLCGTDLNQTIQKCEAHSVLRITVSGPYSEYASTLPATIPFRPSKDSPQLWTVTIPDPCYWTPDSPHCYRVAIQYKDGNGKEHTEQLIGGLQRMEIRNGSIFCDGSRYVVRAISWTLDEDEIPWIELHHSRTAIVVTIHAKGEFDHFYNAVQDAAKFGVSVIGDFSKYADSESDISFVPLSAGLLGVVMPRKQSYDSSSQQKSTQKIQLNYNGLFEKQTANLPIAEVLDYNNLLRELAQPRVPQSTNPIAVRFIAANQSTLDESADCNSAKPTWQHHRALCDKLQAATTAHGNFAGYIIHDGNSL